MNKSSLTNNNHKKDENIFRKAAVNYSKKIAKRVPAYKDLLKKNGIDPEKIKTYKDFKSLPILDKQNYVTKYPLSDLCLDGDVFNYDLISSSSGTTGTALYWLRGSKQGDVLSRLMSGVLDSFDMSNKKTLVIINFSMGVWMAGVAMTMAIAECSRNEGYKFNLFTPGMDIDNTLRYIKESEGVYDQIVLCGYPPFIKDILATGIGQGFDWGKLNTNLIFGGEGFSEEWRDYVTELSGSNNPYSCLSLYGAVDLGCMLGYETPLSIAIRRLYNANREKAEDIFGTEIPPAIFQYSKKDVYFETINEELVVTPIFDTPFVRYNVKDVGDTLTYEEIVKPIKKELESLPEFKDLLKEHKERGDFLYVKGRKNYFTTLYGVNIYPEHIKVALVQKDIRPHVSGKFTMDVARDKDQIMYVNVELEKGMEASDEIQNIVKEVIHTRLLEMSSEFRKLNSVIGDATKPVVQLIEFGNSEYFAPGAKHKWIKG